MNEDTGEAIDDGFESGEEDNVDLISSKIGEKEEHEILVTEQMIRYIPPPQEIKERTYSLHPDIVTGWAPKIPMPKPISLTFPQNAITELLNNYYRKRTNEVSLVYLGPHFDNTYSAWKTYEIEFPYKHLGNQKIIVTNRKFQGMAPGYSQQNIRFQSMFESGNLDAAFKVGDNQYDCFMRVDANTRGHLQWFYFKVFNIRPEVTYQFNICNFQKAKSLYSRGMKPYICEYQNAQEKSIGWHQVGQGVHYSKKIPKSVEILFRKQDKQDYEKYYSLSFKLSTEKQNEWVQIAYCPPYTFTKLNNFLVKLAVQCVEQDILLNETLCLSLGGQKIPLLTISSNVFETETSFKAGKVYKNKMLIFIIGRLHPGEANGSFMMQGFIKYICGDSQEAIELRNRYVFKIVPMMNPDGVVIGNYRTGLSGRDFNREFTRPQPQLFVEVANLKSYLQKCKWIYQKQFCFFLDFHGHSIKKNVFAYGPEFPLTHSKYYESRLLPKLISKKTVLFRYYSCSFKVSQGKASTARAILLRNYGIPFVYTIQASNGSFYEPQQKGNVDFNVEKWQFVGGKICEALYDYWMIFKQIQQAKLKRKRQKQTLLKNKGMISRRIQSSNQKARTTMNFQKKSNIHHRSGTSIAEKLVKKSNLLNNILSQLTAENDKEIEKCSDDQVSQGQSDSQGSQDDIDISSMKTIITGKKEGVCRIKRRKTKEEQIKQVIKQEQPRITKHHSFLTECDYESPRRNFLIERKKRAPHIYKKLYTMSGSSPSPTLSKEKIDPNGTAKIINLNFSLNPIPITPQMDKKPRLKTQVNEEFQHRFSTKSQILQNPRKTFISLQRDTIKRQNKRLGATSVSKDFNMTSTNFRHHEIIGRRIFSEA